MATAGLPGMGPIMTIMIMAQAFTAVSGGRMLMCSGITITAGLIMILAGAGFPAAARLVDFTEAAALLTVEAVATAEEAMAEEATADDSRIAAIL